jgi:probable selenium-dependent hydroxylase accessory protein YqeC
MTLIEALGLRRGELVAVAGAGGKTTLIYQAAAQARATGWRVLVTTTTHMGTLPESLTGPVFVEAEGRPGPALDAALRAQGLATLLGRRVREDKLEGIAPERVDALRSRADLVLVEADGARQRSLKLPAPHEPVVPRAATLVLVVAGLDVLGARLDESRVHRLELVAAAARRNPGDPIDEDAVVAALGHAAGYPARVPEGARLGLFLNKAEEEASLRAAARLAVRLVPPYGFVAAGSARAGQARVLSSRPVGA